MKSGHKLPSLLTVIIWNIVNTILLSALFIVGLDRGVPALYISLSVISGMCCFWTVMTSAVYIFKHAEDNNNERL